MKKISVSMIVKNESSCLERALKSVQGADEIVICDTGSTDNTVEIARRYTDKVYTDYVWNDNFAEARNHAASKCTGDYIFILDADEVLEEGAMDRFKEFEGTALSVRTICAKTEQEHGSIRLHKNTPEIFWIGAAHNYLNVEASHVTGWKVFYHYSDSHALDPDRTLRILRNKVDSGDYTARELYYLGIEYVNRDDHDNAIKTLNDYVAISQFDAEKADAYYQLAKMLFAIGHTPQARRCCLEAIYINPDFREALDMMSRITPVKHRLKWQRFARLAENTGVLFVREPYRIRVTVLCEEDFAGSGYRIVQAVRNYAPSTIDIEHISLRPPTFGHPYGCTVDEVGRQTVQDRLNNSDVIHFKGDFAYNGKWHGFTLPKSAKYIYTVGGSFFRRRGNPAVCMPAHRLNEYKADLHTALTPELCYSEKWIWTPHAWGEFEYLWKPADRFRVLHIPSDTNKKGTEIIKHAMEIVCKQRKDVDFICESGMGAEEARTIKQTAHLYIDQLLTGSYGLSAVEAMSYGVPVVAYTGENYPGICPVITYARRQYMHDPEQLAELITSVLNWNTLEELSKQTYQYAQDVHGKAGAFWANKYGQIINLKIGEQNNE